MGSDGELLAVRDGEPLGALLGMLLGCSEGDDEIALSLGALEAYEHHGCFPGLGSDCSGHPEYENIFFVFTSSWTRAAHVPRF